MTVEAWLLKLKKSSIAPTSSHATTKFILPTVKLLKEKHSPAALDKLQQAHLVTWTKK